MSIDLSALLQEQVGGALSNFASSQLGESPSMASKAVALILPALLVKLSSQTGDASRMTQLFNLVTGPQVDSSLTQVEPSLIDKGRQWLSLLFGDSAGLTNLLAGRTGMSTDNTGTLMAAALPMLLGVLRSQVQSSKLTQPQFVSLLSGQRSLLDRVLGSELATALGLGAVATAPAAVEARPAAAPVTPPPARAVTPAPASGGWMKWLWLALAALAALLLLKFCGQKPAETAVPASGASAESVVVVPVEPASMPASEPAVVVPMASEPAMPAASGTAMAPAPDMTASAAATAAAAASAVASDLAADASAVKYENEVLSFYFATGKTDVDKMAADAVSADIVALGKEGKTLVVSGYNDPRGNKAKNEELSKNRAKAVKAYLMEQGVPEGKIELRKPVQTDGQSGSLAEDRRVDVKAE